jgi:septal ring factor EnvC (AmiA/AmiB activator)
MGRSRAELGRLLGALELYRREPPPALLVTPGSALDAVRATILIRAVEPELRQRAQVLKARSDELQRLRRSILAASEDLLTSESSLADNRAALEQAIRQKSALQRQLDADATDYGRRANLLAGQLKALGVPAEGPALRGIVAPQTLSAPAAGVLIRRYGEPNPIGVNGLAWRTAPGAVVRAPAAGVVSFVGSYRTLTGVVILDVGGGYRLVLVGMDRIAVAEGRRVAAGQPLGTMAATAGPELSLELSRESGTVDPTPMLRLR